MNFFYSLDYFKEYISNIGKKIFLYQKLDDYQKRTIKTQEEISFKKIITYEKRWKKYKKFKKIYIHGIEFVGIGETVIRLFMYLNETRHNDKNSYHIVIPTFFESYKKGIFNNRVFDVFSKKINFIREDEISFWKYLTIFHSNSICIEEFDKYKDRKAEVIPVKLDQPILEFPKKLEAYALNKLNQMGLNKEYVCIHCREVATKTKNFHSNYLDTSCSDSDITSLSIACKYLKENGYQMVRMGKDEERDCKIEGVIDYSNYFYDELMDFYLIANCKFLVGSASGLTFITPYWGKPILILNLNEIDYAFEYVGCTDKDLYIPKKFYSITKKRMLNLYEMMIVMSKCIRYNENYSKIGIEIIDNTELEILEAVKEMDQKLNDTWQVTKEEEQYMEKYWKIMNLWKTKHKFAPARRRTGREGYTMAPMPICFSYLKRNSYLLDVDGID